MKVAIFGGSFDPPHIGHLLVGALILGAHRIDQVWYTPTYKHPLGKNLTAFEHRYEMLLHTIVPLDIDMGMVCTAEEHLAEMEGFESSLTLNLVRYLVKKHPEHEFRWVMGSDLAKQSVEWEGWDEVTKLAPPIIVGRGAYGESQMTLPDYSSSDIRKAIAEGRDFDHMLSPWVADYIKEHGLYGYQKDKKV